MSIEAVQKAIVSMEKQFGSMCSDIGHIKEKVDSMEGHMKVQNGRVGQNEKDITRLDERTKIRQEFNIREHDRTEKAQNESRKFDFEILKKNSNMIMTIILFIIALFNVYSMFVNP